MVEFEVEELLELVELEVSFDMVEVEGEGGLDDQGELVEMVELLEELDELHQLDESVEMLIEIIDLLLVLMLEVETGELGELHLVADEVILILRMLVLDEVELGEFLD